MSDLSFSSEIFEIFNQILPYHLSILIAACKVLDIPQAIPDVALLPTHDIVHGSLVKPAISPFVTGKFRS
jgi:hypothetical protein